MNTYNPAQLEVIAFDYEDVITSSPNAADGDFGIIPKDEDSGIVLPPIGL